MDPWSKEDYSWHIREASMVLEKLPEVNPPSGRVPERGLLVLPILEVRRRRRNRGENRDAGFSARVFRARRKYRLKGAPGGGPSPQAPWWRGQKWGRATWPPRRGGGPLRLSFRLRTASCCVVFFY